MSRLGSRSVLTERAPKSLHAPELPTSSKEANPAPAAIREQLERILKSSFFINSHRYPAFLRYCVERSLGGQSDSLKERNVGVEVFGRAPDYDTAVDHSVRSAASEIRT